MFEKYFVNEVFVIEIERLREENNRFKFKYWNGRWINCVMLIVRCFCDNIVVWDIYLLLILFLNFVYFSFEVSIVIIGFWVNYIRLFV